MSCIGIRNQEAVDLVGHGVSNVVDAVDYVPRKNMGVGMAPVTIIINGVISYEAPIICRKWMSHWVIVLFL